MSQPAPKRGVIRRVGRFAVRQGSFIIGTGALRGLWNFSRRQLLRRRRPCPKCAGGLMFRFFEVFDGEEKEFYGCNTCDHFEPLDVEGDKEALARMQALAKERLAGMTPEQRSNAGRTYCYRSRSSFLFATLLLVVGFYLLLWSDMVATALNVAAMSALFAVQGLRASYRHWQLEMGVFYQPGSFKKWFSTGKWII